MQLSGREYIDIYAQKAKNAAAAADKKTPEPATVAA
jgi:hypothetical protein